MPDPIDRAVALHEQAVALRESGQLRQAHRVCLRALDIFERHCGKRHPDVANVLLELAIVAQARGAYAEGLAHVRRARAILAPLRGDLDFDRLRAQTLGLLGSLHVSRGEYGLAEAPCKRALSIATKKLSPGDVASALNGLAILYKYTSRFDEAARLYKRALAATVEAHGPRHPDVASIMHNLGGLEHSRGRFSRAEPFARKSVAIRRRALGPDHPTVAADIAALAAILHGLGKYKRAEELYRQAIEIFARTLGKTHYEVGFNLGQLAALCQTRRRLDEASRLYGRALVIQEKVLGPRHPQLALTLTNFGELRRTQRRWKEAGTIFDRALTIYRATLGPRHPDTRSCAFRLAEASVRRAIGDAEGKQSTERCDQAPPVPVTLERRPR